MSDTMQITQQVPKSAVAKFVNDAMEMEINSYSLKETARKLKSEAYNLQNSARVLCATSKNKLSICISDYNMAIDKAKDCDTYEKYKKTNYTKKNPWFFLVISFWVSWLMIGLAYDGNESMVPILSIFLGILSVAIYAIISLINYNYNITSYKRKKEILDKDILNYKEQVAIAQKEYDREIKEVENKQKQYKLRANNLFSQANLLEKNAAEIDSSLKKHYSIGIIPPDYRDLIRVMYINRAFRNDQADTMREATLLCDRDIYHIEIKQGLHEIAQAIQCLSSSINQINTKISEMSNELSGIAHNVKMQLSETQSVRYATESVKQSQEQLLWYEQQKWYRDTYK